MDAPDQAANSAESHWVTICAVCEVVPGKEEGLGCINFKTKSGGTSDDSEFTEPNKPGRCIHGQPYPSVRPNPIWGKAEDEAKNNPRRIKYQ